MINVNGTCEVTLEFLLQTLMDVTEQRFALWLEAEVTPEESIYWTAYEDFEHFTAEGAEPLYALVSAHTETLDDTVASQVVSQNRALLEQCWKDSCWAMGPVPQEPENQWLLLDVFLRTHLEEWFNAKYKEHFLE